MLWLPQVMLSSQTPSNVCTCIYHQNTIIALDALHSYIPGISIYSEDFPATCLIAPDTDSCWYANIRIVGLSMYILSLQMMT